MLDVPGDTLCGWGFMLQIMAGGEMVLATLHNDCHRMPD